MSMFQQTLRHNVSDLNQSVENNLEEAQEFLTDALHIAEDMRNLTVVRPDVLLLHSVAKLLYTNNRKEYYPPSDIL